MEEEGVELFLRSLSAVTPLIKDPYFRDQPGGAQDRPSICLRMKL